MNDTCGCCEGTQPLTPRLIANRPGLEALAYRLGTHAAFLETMKARLSNFYLDLQQDELDKGGQPKTTRLYPLRGLTTRVASDPSIALLDGWATVADVLTFYQERIANEGYLRTASERRSILELARLVGYALRPGVAATVYLAYTLDDNIKEPVIIFPGARAQSVPGPGELPQSFETSEVLDARAAWNTLKPRMSRPQTEQSIRQEQLFLSGISTNLKPGEPLLIDFGPSNELYRIRKVEVDAEAKRTRIELKPWFNESLTSEGISMTKSLQDIAERYSKAEDFRVSRTGDIAGQALDYLENLKTADAAAAANIHTRLTGLLEIAERNPRATRLQEWLRAAVKELSDVVEAVARTEGAKAIASTGAFEPPEDPMFATLPRLTARPSVPPRNTLSLDRKIERLFPPKAGDASLQLLGVFSSEQAKIFPLALANTKVTPDSSIKVYALRLKASLFGHNAPPRPVRLDPDRKIIITDEWTINNPFNQAEPVANFTADHYEGHAPLTVQFTDLSTGDVKSWHWDFGDGQTSEGQLTANTFEKPQDYVVTLTVTGAAGKSTAQKVIRVTSIARPVAQFDFKEAATLTVQFTDLSTGDIQSYLWDFGDGHTSDIRSPVHTFAKADNYTVTLTVKDAAGGTDTVQKVVAFAVIGMRRLSAVAAPTLIPTYHQSNVIFLDTEYNISPESWVVIVKPDGSEPIKIIPAEKSITHQSLVAYGLSGKSTRLDLKKQWITDPATEPFSTVRGTSLYSQTEELELAPGPVNDNICNGAGENDADWIELDGLYSDLKSGRWLIVSGERTDVKDANGQPVPGVKASELVMLTEVIQDIATEDGRPYYYTLDKQQTGTLPLATDKLHTWIRLAKKLEYCYRRDKVTIYGNVVKATNGETRNEVLGSGDGSKPFQSFGLKQPPLTYVAAPTPAGAESTLHVRVNDIEWHETDSLAGLERTDRNFITRTDDESKTTVIFGNGQQGARPPTGVENIKAVYRSGIGKPGNVKAEQISLLVTRPLGVKEVINPMRASGGADKESRDQARKNAPLGVLALDRLVSTQDYADFARTFAGIGKASAARLTAGRRQLVHVTIAGADDIPIDQTSDLYHNLTKALRDYGDPYLPIMVEVRELMLIVLSANVRVQPDYQWESVAPKVRAKLLDTFSFERRELGQDVLLSEVISAIQSVEGVAYVDVDMLGGVSEKDETGKLRTPKEIADEVQQMIKSQQERPKPRVLVNLDSVKDGVICPAQLAFLTPDVEATLILNEVKV